MFNELTTHDTSDGFSEIALRWKTRHAGADRHDYLLALELTNLGNEIQGPYHVDLRFPRAVIHHPHAHPYYVSGRSTDRLAFFRVDSERHLPQEKIYPGDTRALMTLDYHMTNSLFWNNPEVMQLPVDVVLYQPGLRPVTVSGVFQDFERF